MRVAQAARTNHNQTGEASVKLLSKFWTVVLPTNTAAGYTRNWKGNLMFTLKSDVFDRTVDEFVGQLLSLKEGTLATLIGDQNVVKLMLQIDTLREMGFTRLSSKVLRDEVERIRPDHSLTIDIMNPHVQLMIPKKEA
jgi:hypothetical protein